MALGVEVGLDPSDIVLDGDHAPPPQKGEGEPPIFGPCLLWPRSPISATAELLLRYFSDFGIAFSAHCVKVVEDISLHKVSATEI